MKRNRIYMLLLMISIPGLILGAGFCRAASPSGDTVAFPPGLQSYGDQQIEGILQILIHRVRQEPFNLVATAIFLCAIIHTFLTSKFMAVSHKWERAHEKKIEQGLAGKHSVHHGAELFHFLGEVEAVFGIWSIALVGAMTMFFDWGTALNYISHRVNFTEALFVVVIMTLASTRPILKLAEKLMRKAADLLGGSLTAWWLTILTLGPVLGSFITEPAAMTICALILAEKFYTLGPSTKFKYATIGVLFVNISVGGTLTHFAAPPVLMVAGPWKWDTLFMATRFGWEAVLGILISNGCYYLVFRKELSALQEKFALSSLKDHIQETYLKRRDMDSEFEKIAAAVNAELEIKTSIEGYVRNLIDQTRERLERRFIPRLVAKGVDRNLVEEAFQQRFAEIKLREMRRIIPGLLPPEERAPFVDPDWDNRDDPVPGWVTCVHLIFMGWTIFNSHHPELFIPGLLFFLGFAQVSAPYQNRIDLKPPLLVGFFLGGLVVHGGLQGWWIEPVLGGLTEIPLMAVATILTAFNDNAAITFLSTLVPGFTDGLKYAVVAGAVAGGGLTVIANAPNPAGQSILKKFFENGVSPAGLLAGAIVPTIVLWGVFLVFM